ncbi:helicase-associated domain-containing protein [Ornithinimicrobium cerasi]|uniref:Helicase conserved C-terminal domain-containing protein n=1 Tax=Ornithinimicrobium cerasi TaxID=2248773 RepID=A0A285VTL9_9MICO|nr:helicase-associated domain-containing protein [Ornithinimicrobium cerasi]SOC55971.1 Helicase conserved C-terminal domain-containing protein [Ornithinimicrobium cerasi]
MRSLADDLRGRTDAELTALLQARPDLARPAPGDVTSLTARATTRASIQRALDGLDLAHLQALEAVVVAAPASAGEVAGLLACDVARAEELTGRLRELALCWRSPEGLRPARPVAEVVGDPAGLGPPGADVPQGSALEQALAAQDARARSLLDALTWGPPFGALGRTGPMAAAAAGLVDAGLLVRLDEDHVQLPRQVALALRGGRLHRSTATAPPEVEHSALDPDVVDAAAGGRAADLVVLVTELVDLWGARPPRVLRAGGVAVRDLTRLAAHLEIDPDQAAWLLETAHAAGLLAVDDGGRTTEPSATWVPTTLADEWLEDEPGARWAALAQAWWTMPAAPSLVGAGPGPGSGAGGRVNALSTHTSYPLARVRRQDTLRAMAALPPGTAPTEDGLEGLLRWRHPLRTTRLGGEHGGTVVVLREAEWAAVTGRGALAGPGRRLVTAGTVEEAAGLMEPLVPPAVDHVLLQADLTAIAPGRLDGPVRTLMHLVSDVESRGGATVHRFGEASVRRALDAGWSADRVLADLAAASRTGVPQPLDYLVRDVARRHGQARVGSCAAYLRSDDPALLDRVEHDRALGLLQWRRVAPTVLVSPVPASTVLDVLRDEQYGPVVEGGDGGLELGAPRWHRTTARPGAPVRVSSVDEVVARQVVALMRRGEGARASGLDDAGAHTDPLVVSAVLREAAATGEAVWIGYADEVGGVATYLLRPESVVGGRISATVGDGNALRTFLLHRVTRVRTVD